jgi:3-oxoacyl-ACP reductase-like protein
MDDIAYDIAHLFEVEPQRTAAAAPRTVKVVPTAAFKPAAPSIAAAQQALARELMQSAPVHDALVQQYLRMRGDTFPETAGE